MSQENVDVIRRMIGAFNRDDLEAVLAAFDDGCEIVEPAEMPDSPALGFHGHEGIREWMKNLRGVAGIGFEPRRFTTSGDAVLCELDSHGVGQVSGVPVAWTTFALFWLHNGKITRLRVYLEHAAALEAAGLRE